MGCLSLDVPQAACCQAWFRAPGRLPLAGLLPPLLLLHVPAPRVHNALVKGKGAPNAMRLCAGPVQRALPPKPRLARHDYRNRLMRHPQGSMDL